MQERVYFGLLALFTLVPSTLMLIHVFWEEVSFPPARLFFMVNCCIMPVLFIDIIGSKFVFLNVYSMLLGILLILITH